VPHGLVGSTDGTSNNSSCGASNAYPLRQADIRGVKGRYAGVDQRLLWPQVLHSDIDLLNPPAELERTKHKLKRLVQSPNSFFMDVKCTGCFSM